MSHEEDRDAMQLLVALRSGTISPSDLQPKDVEAVAYIVLGERLPEWTRLRLISLERNRVGPIDIVATLRAFEDESPFASKTDQLVYVECKHYTRSLSADSASKVFVEAILHGPQLLLIISQTELAPQAREYASRLFGEEGLFKATGFERWPLERLIWPTSQATDRSSGTSKRSPSPRPSIHSWAIHDVGSSQSTLLASSDMPATPRRLLLSDDGAHVFTLSVSDFPTSPPHIRCAATGRSARLSWTDTTSTGSGHLSCSLADLLAPGEVASEFVVETDSPRSQTRHPIPLPTVTRPDAPRFRLPELRSDAVKSMLALRHRLGSFAILCVYGAAGIGKSHLCSQACAALSQQDNARVVRIPLGAGAGQGAFLPLMLSALLGGSTASDGSLSVPTSELLHAVAMRLLPNDLDERDSVAQQVSSLQLDSVGAETLLQLIVRALVESQQPLIVHFSNCQQADPYMRRLIGLFAVNLVAHKAGQVTLLYEVRTATDQDSVTELIGDMAPGEVEQHVQMVPIGTVSPTDLRNAIDGLVLTADLVDVAGSLHDKTGGNPLFLIHAIEYLIDRNYLRAHSRGGASQLEILDLPGLLKTIQELPGELSFLLESRTRHLLTAQEGTGLARFAAIASLVGRQFNLSRMHDLLGWQAADISLALRRAQQLRLVRVTESGVSAAFVHDLMFAAVSSVTNTIHQAQEELQCVVSRLSECRSFGDRLVGARALARLGSFAEAFEWGNDAFEAAAATGSLPDQASALTHCRAALLSDDITTATARRQLITIGVHLSDVEAQVGSQMDALRVIESTREQVLEAGTTEFRESDGLSVEERILELSRLANREAIVHLRVYALERAVAAIARFATDHLGNHDLGGRTAGLLGRVVLACTYSNRPKLAIAAAQASLGHVPAQSDPDQLSALLSDIGRAYLLASPAESLTLWELSAHHAESRRQATHCALNLAVAHAICDGTWLRDDEIKQLSRSIQAVGASNHACRLSLYVGVRAAVQDDIPNAVSSLRQALRTARVTGLRYLEWQCHHNLAVLLQGQGEAAEAYAHIEKACSILDNAARIAIGEVQLEPAVDSLLSGFGDSRSDGGSELIAALPASPYASGGVLVFARCCRDLASVGFELPQANQRLLESLADECPEPASALCSRGTVAFHLE